MKMTLDIQARMPEGTIGERIEFGEVDIDTALQRLRKALSNPLISGVQATFEELP